MINKKICLIILVFLLLTGMCGCSEKKVYGSPSEHNCIYCGEVAEHYCNKRTNSEGNLIDVYLCDDCYQKDFLKTPIAPIG